MTPSERERRIEAARSWMLTRNYTVQSILGETDAAGIIDAADEAVPMVSAEAHLAEVERNRENGRLGWAERDEQEARADRAEAAVRDFAKALREIEDHPWKSWHRITATRALNDHPSFSGEEGTEG